MKKILINSAIFLFIFSCWNIYLKNSSYFFKQEREYQENIDLSLSKESKILLLGDSHLASLKKVDLNPVIGNLAYGADGIKEMYAKALIIVEQNPNLEYVFISTEPQMFNAGNSPNGTFLDKYMLNSYEARELYNKNKLDVICDHVPLFNNDYLNYFRNKVYSLVKGSTEPNKEKTWGELSNEEKNLLSSNLGKSDHAAIMTQAIDTVYFRKMFKLFEYHKIKVVGIRFPVTPKYMEQCSPENIEKVGHFLDSFNFYKQLDYTHSIDSLDFFEDPDHMKARGVERIAKAIQRETGLSIIQ